MAQSAENLEETRTAQLTGLFNANPYTFSSRATMQGCIILRQPFKRRGEQTLLVLPPTCQLFVDILLSSQFWPMWSKSRQALGQLPIGRTTLSG